MFPSTTTTPEPTTEVKTTEAKPTTTEAEPETTTTKEHTPNECTEAMEVFPYPGNCHKYYVCVPTDTESIFDIIVSFDKCHFFKDIWLKKVTDL